MAFDFDKLPEELLEFITLYLHTTDLSRFSRVNKKLYQKYKDMLVVLESMANKGHTIAYCPSLALKGIKTKTEQWPAIIDLLKNYPETNQKEEWQTRAAKIQGILGCNLCSILDECTKEPGKTYEQVISQLSCHNPVLLHELALCYFHSDAPFYYATGVATAAHISAAGKNFPSTFLFLYFQFWSTLTLKKITVDPLPLNSFIKNFVNQQMVKDVNELIISFYQLENQISTDSNQWINDFFLISDTIWSLNNHFTQELGSQYLIIYKNLCVLLKNYGLTSTARLAKSHHGANKQISYLKTFLLGDKRTFIQHYTVDELLNCDTQSLTTLRSAQFSDYCNRYPNSPIEIESLKVLGIAACSLPPETRQAIMEQFETIDDLEFYSRYNRLRTHPNETLFFEKFIIPVTILEFDFNLFNILLSHTTIARYLLKDCIDIAHQPLNEIVKIEKQNIEIILAKINKNNLDILSDAIISAETDGYKIPNNFSDHPFLTTLINIYTVEKIFVSDITIAVKTLTISQVDFDGRFQRNCFFNRLLETTENSAIANSLFKTLVSFADKVKSITQNEDFSMLRLLFTVLENEEEATQQKILAEIVSTDDLLQSLQHIFLALEEVKTEKNCDKIYFRIGNLPSVEFLQLIRAMSEKKLDGLEFCKLLLMPEFTDKTIIKMLRLLIIKSNKNSRFSQENFATLHAIISDFNVSSNLVGYKISFKKLNVLLYKLSLSDLGKLHKEKLIISSSEKNFELSLLQIICYDFPAEAKDLNYFDQIVTTSKEARPALTRQFLDSKETIFDKFKEWVELQRHNKMETDDTTKFLFFPKQTNDSLPFKKILKQGLQQINDDPEDFLDNMEITVNNLANEISKERSSRKRKHEEISTDESTETIDYSKKKS